MTKLFIIFTIDLTDKTLISFISLYEKKNFFLQFAFKQLSRGEK